MGSSKVLTVMSLTEGVNKEIKLVFKPSELDSRTVWSCVLEDESIADLEALLSTSRQEN